MHRAGLAGAGNAPGEREDVLARADGVVDPAANAVVIETTAQLTGDDPVLAANARR